MTITDAGPLFALFAPAGSKHSAAKAALEVISLPMAVTWPCFTEAMYLAYSVGGWAIQSSIWHLVLGRHVLIVDLDPDCEAKIEELMRRYADIPMDLADATLVALADQSGLSTIFTFDSHFYAYRSSTGGIFNVVSIR